MKAMKNLEKLSLGGLLLFIFAICFLLSAFMLVSYAMQESIGSVANQASFIAGIGLSFCIWVYTRPDIPALTRLARILRIAFIVMTGVAFYANLLTLLWLYGVPFVFADKLPTAAILGLFQLFFTVLFGYWYVKCMKNDGNFIRKAFMERK